MIFVTGATGMVGGAVLAELIARGGKPARAMCRTEKDFAKMPPGVEPVVGDFADSTSLAKALAGVDTAFLVCAPVPDLVQLETNFLLAARDAGVGHIVINSALGAADFPKSFPSWHSKVEDKAAELNLPVTILRPNGFMQNIAGYFLPTITTQDAFYGTIGDARISLIDVRDVAAAAVSALLSKATTGQVFELSGPTAVNYATLAGMISKMAGRTISYVNLTPDQIRQAMISSGMPEAQATAVVELDDYYRSGRGEASDQALRQLLGKQQPRTLADYLAEIAPKLQKAAH